MHIHGIPNEGSQPGRSGQARRVVRPESGSAGVAGRPTLRASGELKGPQPTQVDRLAADLHRTPAVRHGLVAKAMERIQSGYYLTQEAAEQTADRLLS